MSTVGAYILVIFFRLGNASGAIAQEFNSESSCAAALQAIRNEFRAFDAGKCVKK